MTAQPIPSPMTADEFIRVHGEGDDVCEGTLNGCSHDRVKNNLKKLFDRIRRRLKLTP